MSNNLEDFKVGTKVTLHKNSRFYKMNSENNPAGVCGVVRFIRSLGTYKVDVQWSNGHWNSYQPADLKILGESVNG